MRIIPFMRYKWWFLLSLSAVTVFAIVLVFIVRLDLGIDFRGGVRMEIGLEQPATVDEVRSLVRDLGIQDPVVQSVAGASGATSYMITAEQMTPDQQKQVESELNSRYTVKPDSKSVEQVGASFGKETTKRAFYAVFIAVIAIILYLTFRFEFKFAIPAIVALIHDVGLTLGIYAASNRLVTSATVAAILTILGYSVHDTIIVFDRMRENTLLMKKETYSDMADLSIAQTMIRSINTTICLLLPLLAILIFGGPTLKDFAFALTIGVITGTYSSFFVATPLAVLWKEREPRYRKRVLAAGPGGEVILETGVLSAEGGSAGGKGASGKAEGAVKPGTSQAVQPRVSRKPRKGRRPVGDPQQRVPSGHLGKEEKVVTDEVEDKTADDSMSSAAQSFRDLIERTFLAGMGAAALTKDRVQDLVEEFVRRGQLNADEGREVVDRLVSRSRDEARSVLRKADSSLQGAYRELGLTTKRQLEDVESRLRQLEHRVRLLEAAADSKADGASGG